MPCLMIERKKEKVVDLKSAQKALTFIPALPFIKQSSVNSPSFISQKDGQ